MNYQSKISADIIDSDVKFAYYYCLEKVNSKKGEIMTKYSLWFGREYYIRLLNDLKLAEARVRNDIWATKSNSH